MNFKLDNEMKAGRLGLGEAVTHGGDALKMESGVIASDRYIITAGGGSGGTIRGTHGGTSSVSGGACGSIGAGSGDIRNAGGSSWLHDRIQAACQDNLTITTATSAIKMAGECVAIGQHLDRRIASLQEQLSVMQGIRSQLEGVGALDLPTQTLRDALY